MNFVLLHSPLVGPATWTRVGDVLREQGHHVDVPDLRQATSAGTHGAVVGAALDQIEPAPDVLVGHSGAGFYLPLVAARLGASAPRLIFVDAGIPPCQGVSTPSADFLDQLRALAVNGWLPKWSEWWGTGVMEELIPSAAWRRQVEAELNEVPLALYESPIVMPAGWCDFSAAFLLLSEGYREESTVARGHGWPVIERLGEHLDIVNEPAAITGLLVELAESDPKTDGA